MKEQYFLLDITPAKRATTTVIVSSFDDFVPFVVKYGLVDIDWGHIVRYSAFDSNVLDYIESEKALVITSELCEAAIRCNHSGYIEIPIISRDDVTAKADVIAKRAGTPTIFMTEQLRGHREITYTESQLWEKVCDIAVSILRDNTNIFPLSVESLDLQERLCDPTAINDIVKMLKPVLCGKSNIAETPSIPGVDNTIYQHVLRYIEQRTPSFVGNPFARKWMRRNIRTVYQIR